MSKDKSHKKPVGELGSLEVGKGTATYRSQPWPSDKRTIEQAALDGALRAAKSRGVNLYELTQPPQQNEEKDFDFTLETLRGAEDLDLMEVVLQLGKGGCDAVRTYYSIAEMVAQTLANILKKSRRYGRPLRPLHLLLYSTDWRFWLSQDVVDALAAAVAREKHVFTTITYSPGDGFLATVFPRQLLHEPPSASDSSFLVFGDMRCAQVEADGSMIVPVSIPQLESPAGHEQPTAVATIYEDLLTANLPMKFIGYGVNVKTNTVTGSATSTIRVNGSNGAMTVTISGNSEHVIVEDLSHTQGVLTTDKINHVVAVGSDGMSLEFSRFVASIITSTTLPQRDW